VTTSDDDTPVTAHRVIDGPPTFAWTDEPFSLRFSMARPELEAIAQRMLETGTEEAPVRTQWLRADPAWSEDGAVYFQLGTWIDGYGVVYDPDGSTPWSRNESLAPGWYQWMG